MLCLSRFVGEAIVIGDAIRIEVAQVNGRRVRLACQAPAEIPIWREEVLPKLSRERASTGWTDAQKLLAAQEEIRRLKDRLCQEAGARAELEQLVREAGLLPQVTGVRLCNR